MKLTNHIMSRYKRACRRGHKAFLEGDNDYNQGRFEGVIRELAGCLKLAGYSSKELRDIKADVELETERELIAPISHFSGLSLAGELKENGFDRAGSLWSKVLTGSEMEAFLLDVDGISACLLEIDIDKGKTQYAVFEHVPTVEEITNANIFEECDFRDFIDYLQG